jgi:hypothetical protein
MCDDVSVIKMLCEVFIEVKRKRYKKEKIRKYIVQKHQVNSSFAGW